MIFDKLPPLQKHPGATPISIGTVTIPPKNMSGASGSSTIQQVDPERLKGSIMPEGGWPEPREWGAPERGTPTYTSFEEPLPVEATEQLKTDIANIQLQLETEIPEWLRLSQQYTVVKKKQILKLSEEAANGNPSGGMALWEK